METKVLNAQLKEQECDILVIGIYEKTETLSGVTASVDEALGELISKFVIQKDKFEGKFKNTYLLQTYGKIPANKVLIIGLGEKEKFTPNKLRELSAKIVKKALSVKAKKVCIDLGKLEFDASISGKVVAEGALIGNYSFDKYKTKKENETKIEEFILVEKDYEKFTKLETGVDKGIKIANAMSFARNLANEPAQYATPTKLAETAKKIEGIKTKIYEKDDIEKMGMGAFFAVSKGSCEFPKFIHMKYSPSNPKKKIALIGKGITFDSGGLDLKPSSSMVTMKDDMSGAACVLSVMNALRQFNPDIEVHGIIAACENMPGCAAYKPGDILTAKNNKTIEVDNTDAEGRLTLADALCFACEQEVDEIIDIATLTGACVVALGTHAAGIMGNNQELIDKLIKIGEDSGERFWQLPMFEEYFEGLKSDVADMKNTGGRWGGASSAGMFLKEFVKDDVAWVHMDIAGVAFLEKPQKELIKGATGVGVRTLLNYILTI
ncbi:MAG: leucyl aminopeptidase [Candidatus Gastranaerophilales bacterium]|nr:leucyl aminopeptidase [Candidatus Gastranaerophilales bacterium]